MEIRKRLLDPRKEPINLISLFPSKMDSDTDGRAVRNLVHASGSATEAEQEIGHWFSADELAKYTHLAEKILYDVNLDGILE